VRAVNRKHLELIASDASAPSTPYRLSCRQWASRWDCGKWLGAFRLPEIGSPIREGTQARYEFARPPVTEESRNRTIGTAIAVATMPLNRIPNFMKRLRRERVVSLSFDIEKLLMVLRFIRSGIGLSRVLNASRNEPGNNVRDFLVGHGFTGDVSTPVRGAQFGAAGDDYGAQSLIADQREKRIIGNGAALWSAAAVRAVAGCAVSLVGSSPCVMLPADFGA